MGVVHSNSLGFADWVGKRCWRAAPLLSGPRGYLVGKRNSQRNNRLKVKQGSQSLQLTHKLLINQADSCWLWFKACLGRGMAPGMVQKSSKSESARKSYSLGRAGRQMLREREGLFSDFVVS